MPLTAEELAEFEAMFGKPTKDAPKAALPATRAIPDTVPTKLPGGPETFDQAEFDQFIKESDAKQTAGSMETYGDAMRSYLNSASLGIWPALIDKASEVTGIGSGGMQDEVAKGAERSPTATTAAAVAGKVPWFMATRGAVAPLVGGGATAGGIAGLTTSVVDQGAQVLRGERDPTDVDLADLGVSTAAGAFGGNPAAFMFPGASLAARAVPTAAKDWLKSQVPKSVKAGVEVGKSAFPAGLLEFVHTIRGDEQQRAKRRAERGQ